MAVSNYDNFRDNILGGGVHARIDMDTNDIRFTLYDVTQKAFDATHQDVADITAPTTAIGDSSWRSGTLSGKTIGSGGAGVGRWDFTDYVLASVAAGATAAEALVFFDYATATDSTSPLMFYLDNWTGLPVTPNGGNINVNPHANGVFEVAAS